MRLVVLGGFMGFSEDGESRVVLSGSWVRWEGSGGGNGRFWDGFRLPGNPVGGCESFGFKRCVNNETRCTCISSVILFTVFENRVNTVSSRTLFGIIHFFDTRSIMQGVLTRIGPTPHMQTVLG